MKRIKQKLIDWSNKNYFEPIYFKTTDLVDDLVCFLNANVNKKSFIISESEEGEKSVNLIFISGFINHKNLSLLKLKYDRLEGKKIVITAGMMVNNDLNFPLYNNVSIPDNYFIVDRHIYGANPTKKDFAQAILSMVDKDE